MTGRRLVLNAIGIYSHSGKIDYDHGCRWRSRKSWRQDARKVKRRYKRALLREQNDQLEDAQSA